MGSWGRRGETADETTVEIGEWEVKIRRLLPYFKIHLSLLVCLFLAALLYSLFYMVNIFSSLKRTKMTFETFFSVLYLGQNPLDHVTLRAGESLLDPPPSATCQMQQPLPWLQLLHSSSSLLQVWMHSRYSFLLLKCRTLMCIFMSLPFVLALKKFLSNCSSTV